MDKNKIWIAGSVLLMVVALGLGWFLGVEPQLSSAAVAESQRASVQALNVQQEATLASLKKNFANMNALKAQLADLSESVPSDTAIPAFVDEVDAIGSSTGVTVAGIAVADAKPYTPVSPPAPTGGAATPTPTATPSPGATPTATPTPTPTAVPGMPPVTSSKLTSANFSSLAVTLTVKGTYGQALAFVNGLQTGKRLFLVNGINTTTATSSSGSAKAAPGEETTTVNGLIFVVTTTPTGTPTPTPTPSK